MASFTRSAKFIKDYPPFMHIRQFQGLAGLTLFLLSISILSFNTACGQCPPIATGLAVDTTCETDSVAFAGSPAPNTRYNWEFCLSDSLQTSGTNWTSDFLTGSNIGPYSLSSYQDDTTLTLFAVVFNAVNRYDFPGGPTSPPIITDLGTPGSNWGSNSGLQFVTNDSGDIYAFAVNRNNSEVFRYSFDSITDPNPTELSIVSPGAAIGDRSNGLTVLHDNIGLHLLIAQREYSHLVHITLDPNDLQTVLGTQTIPMPNKTIDIASVRTCDGVFAFAINTSNDSIYQIDFGSTINTSPTITAHDAGAGGKFRISLLRSHGLHTVVASGSNNAVLRLDFGLSFTNTNPTRVNETLPSAATTSLLTRRYRGALYSFGLNRSNKELVGYAHAVGPCPVATGATNGYYIGGVPPKIPPLTTGQHIFSVEKMGIQGAYSQAFDTLNVVSNPTSSFLFGCSPSSPSFTSNSTLGGSQTALDHLWNFGDGNAATTPNPTHTYTGAGPFNVQLIVTDQVGCSDTSAQSVALNAPPTAAIGVLDSARCNADSLELIDNSSSGTLAILSRVWRLGAADTLTNPTTPFNYRFDSAGVFPVTLVVEDAAGCRDSTTQSLSIAALDFEYNFDCNYQTLTASALPEYPNDAVTSYLWSFGNGQSSTQANPIPVTYTTPDTQLVTLRVQTASGCNDSIAYEVLPRILELTDTLKNLCRYDTLQLAASNGFDSYTWDFSPPDLLAEPSSLWLINDFDQQVGSTFFTENISLYRENGQWFGFVTTDDRIVRLEFGSTLDAAPTVVDIGNPGNTFSWILCRLKMLPLENNEWIGITTDWNQDKIVRLHFDSITDNSPTPIEVDYSSVASRMRGIDMITTDTSFQSIAAEQDFEYLIFSEYDSDPTGAVLRDSLLSISPYTASQIEIVETCDGIYGLASDLDGALLTIYFGDHLLDTLAINDFPTQSVGHINLTYFNKFGQHYVLLSGDNTAEVYTYGESLSNTPTLINTPNLPQRDGVDMAWEEGEIRAIGVDRSNTNLLGGYVFAMPPSTQPGWLSGQSTGQLAPLSDTIHWAIEGEAIDVIHKGLSGIIVPQTNVDQVLIDSLFCQSDSVSPAISYLPDTLSLTNSEWRIAGVDTVNALEPTFIDLPAGVLPLEVDVELANGCTRTLQSQLSVKETPQTGFEVTSAACATGEVTFTDTTLYSTGSIVNANWNMGIDESTLVNPGSVFDYEFLNPGAKVVSLSVLADNGCADTTTQTLPLPSANFTIDQTCVGIGTTVSPEIDYLGDPVSSVSWTWPGGGSAQLNPPAFQIGSAGSTDIQLVVNTQGGCEDTITKPFTFNTPPAVSIDVPGVQCSGEPMLLSDNSTVAAPVTGRRWRFPDAGDVFNTNSPTQPYTFDTAGTFGVQLVVTVEGGCQDSTSEQITILPPPTITLADTFLACSGQPVVVGVDSLQNVGNAPRFNWSYMTDSGTFFSEKTNPRFVSDSVLQRRVQLQVTNDAGCVSTDSTLLIFRASPRVSLSGGPLSGNVPLTVNFTPTAEGFDSLLWQFSPTDALVSFADTSQSYTYAIDGSQLVQLIAYNSSGCTDTASVRLDLLPEIIGVWDIVLTELIPRFNTSTGDLEVTAQVENRSNLLLNQFTYDLRVKETTIIDSVNFDPIAPGNTQNISLPPTFRVNPYIQPAGICLEISAPNGFVDIDTTNNRLCTTLGEGLRVDAVYPSPFFDVLNFRVYVDAATSQVLDVSLLNVMGQVMGEWQYSSPSGTYEEALDLIDMAEGIFYLRLRAGDGEVMVPVVKR